MRRRLIAGALAVAAVIGIGTVAAFAPTQAAWTDRVYSSAIVTAGNWAPKNSCTAADMYGQSVPCTVAGISFTGWGTAGDYTRGYSVSFTAPSAMTITFTIDLRTATDANGQTPGFTWTKAGLSSSAPLLASGGWTCAALPILTARTKDWQTNPYFQIYEDRTGHSVTCS